MMQCSKSRSGRKAWIVLLGCCLLQGGSLGLVQNSMGVFFSAVRKPGSRNSFSKLSMPTQGLPKKPSFIL